MSEKNTGRVTIPTNLDVVPETIELMKRWGADAIRDCDGTEFPEELTKTGAKIYATYYTTRKDNEWAKANPDEVQQCYIMSGFYTAVESELQIPLMKGISDELMQVNTRDWAVVFSASLHTSILFATARNWSGFSARSTGRSCTAISTRSACSHCLDTNPESKTRTVRIGLKGL